MDNAQERGDKARIAKHDLGPWRVRKDEDGRWRICSDNFTRDAELIVTGDFESDEAFLGYALDIARRLSDAHSATGSSEAKDAARYRFLRDFKYHDEWNKPRWEVSVCVSGMGSVYRGERLDENVDLAMNLSTDRRLHER